MDVGDEMSDFHVTLPATVTGEPEQADDGTQVLRGQADIAYQDLSEGSVRVATVTESPAGPHSFEYTFEGQHLRELPDGRVAVENEVEGRSVTTTLVERPWAFDANGNAVDTHYELHGDTLRQVIEPGQDATYPIIADPTITFGWGIYVTYSHSEVEQLKSLVGASQFLIVLCAAIPQPYGAACAAITGPAQSSIYNT